MDWDLLRVRGAFCGKSTWRTMFSFSGSMCGALSNDVHASSSYIGSFYSSSAVNAPLTDMDSLDSLKSTSCVPQTQVLHFALHSAFCKQFCPLICCFFLSQNQSSVIACSCCFLARVRWVFAKFWCLKLLQSEIPTLRLYFTVDY